MEFDAAGAIQQKYAPILGNDELAFKLGIRFHTFHCEENRTPENLEMEFKSLLVDMGWERKLGLLADMLGKAEGKEGEFVIDALLEGLQKCGINGYVKEPANFWERKGLPPEVITAAEDAVIAAAQMRAKDGGNLLGDAAVLLKRASTPWRVADSICKACAGTQYFTKIADLFARDGMPADSYAIAMDALFKSVDEIEKMVRREIEKIECAGLDEKESEARKREARKPMGLVVYMLRKKKLPGSFYIRVIKACRNCGGMHGFGLVAELGELFSRPDVTDKARAEAEKTLLEGEMEACVSAGYTDHVSGIKKAVGIPEKVREKAGEILGKHAQQGEGRASGEHEAGRRPTPATPVVTDGGFVASRFRTPSERSRGVTPAEAAPTICAELRKSTGKKG